MSDTLHLREIDPPIRPSVTDQVYEALRDDILALRLVPGAKISEVEVAAQMGASRQPVRDAFFRLSQLGFLTIRPQRATTVALISQKAVMQARFIRAAIEAETVRLACSQLSNADLTVLEQVLDRQAAAVDARDRDRFHAEDDAFHREICLRTGCGFAWTIILENKAHMDRVRLLSLSFAAPDAYADHLAVMQAIRARDSIAAMAAMRAHLNRIKDQIVRIRDDNLSYFAPGEDAQPEW